MDGSPDVLKHTVTACNLVSSGPLTRDCDGLPPYFLGVSQYAPWGWGCFSIEFLGGENRRPKGTDRSAGGNTVLCARQVPLATSL